MMARPRLLADIVQGEKTHDLLKTVFKEAYKSNGAR
jgi:hypothetical protein